MIISVDRLRESDGMRQEVLWRRAYENPIIVPEKVTVTGTLSRAREERYGNCLLWRRSQQDPGEVIELRCW